MSNNTKVFLNRLNTKMGGGNIFVRECEEYCFEIRCENSLLQAEQLTPSKMFRNIIAEEALACFGADIRFNNLNNLFWVNL